LHRRSFALFVILFAFWLVISSEADLQHVLTGVLIAGLTAWFWHDLVPRLPEVPSARELLRLGHYLVLLIVYVIQANIAVARTLLFSRHSVKPVFMVLDPGLNSHWGRILLATCITITPGTITVDIDPETGWFIVHALTEKTGIDLLYWRLIDKIRRLETRETEAKVPVSVQPEMKPPETEDQRGVTHAVDAGRIDGSDPRGACTGDYRTDSDRQAHFDQRHHE